MDRHKANWYITQIADRKADSTGRRNTFVYILFEQSVECLCRRLPVEGFAWSCVQSMGDSAQLFSAMTVGISALGKLLAKQTVCTFIAAALPCIARQAIAQQSAERGL